MQPTWPFGKGRNGRPPPPFFPLDARPGLVVAILMGLQHALAMVGGIITPPLLVYRVTVPEVRAPLQLFTPLPTARSSISTPKRGAHHHLRRAICPGGQTKHRQAADRCVQRDDVAACRTRRIPTWSST